MMRGALWAALLLAVVAGPAAAEEQPTAPGAGEPERAWCAEELETLPGEVCATEPAADAPRRDVLVVFLHGVIKQDTTWQWAQQRSIARAAKKNGFSVIMPRGRTGIGPKGMRDYWTWPTSVRAQKEIESELQLEWNAARSLLEKRRNKPFSKVLVFGFSNGAYYATSLALRGQLPVQGYAVFAGGAGAKYLVGPAQSVTRRAPIYVGWGSRDKAKKDPEGLARALKQLGWRHRTGARKGVGHTMTDSQISDAVDFLAGG